MMTSNKGVGRNYYRGRLQAIFWNSSDQWGPPILVASNIHDQNERILQARRGWHSPAEYMAACAHGDEKHASTKASHCAVLLQASYQDSFPSLF